MGSVSDRRKAAMIGALVADAAAQPLHWVYDQDKLDTLIEGKEEIEFFAPSANPFYQITTGCLSCYGDQSYVILRSLVECKGLNVEHLNKATYDFFGPKSEYENAINAEYAGTKEKKTRTSEYPIKGPWRQKTLKYFIKHYEAGTELGSDNEDKVDCVARVVPVVAMYAGKPEMLQKVEDVIRLTQNGDMAVTAGLAAARLLEYYILNGPSPQALDVVISELSNQKRINPQDLDRTVAGYLREVLKHRNTDHFAATRHFRND